MLSRRGRAGLGGSPVAWRWLPSGVGKAGPKLMPIFPRPSLYAHHCHLHASRPMGPGARSGSGEASKQEVRPELQLGFPLACLPPPPHYVHSQAHGSARTRRKKEQGRERPGLSSGPTTPFLTWMPSKSIRT